MNYTLIQIKHFLLFWHNLSVIGDIICYLLVTRIGGSAFEEGWVFSLMLCTKVKPFSFPSHLFLFLPTLPALLPPKIPPVPCEGFLASLLMS